MLYALVHYPEIDTVLIDELRTRYDPQVDLIRPHITLVFPLPESVGEENLVSHIESVMGGWHPFKIRLKGLPRSPDCYLFLLVEDGNADITRLHDDLYQGMLVDYFRPEIPYVPHVTLGVFTNEPDRLAEAFREANRMNMDFQTCVERLSLVKINDDRSWIVESWEFLIRE